MNSKQRIRSRLVFALILAGAGLLVSSLYWTQIVKGGVYASKANQQYVKPATSLFDRGTIFFESKDGTRISAATLGSGSVVFMNPTALANPEAAYEALSQYLTLDKTDFMSKAAKPNDHYEIVMPQVSNAIAASIKGLQIPGVGVAAQTWRFYPGGSLAAHELGLIGEDVNSPTHVGRYGLERSYEDTLFRLPVGPSVNVFAGLFSGLRDSVLGASGAKEGDIVSTIEPTVEGYLEKILNETSTAWHPDEIGGIVMDPQTGEILAMSSLPTFDPNDTAKIKNVAVFSDPLVEHVYEMGSIMKPLTMATALDAGAVRPDSTYDDVGCMTLNGKKICNYDGKARGVIPMQQILSQSLNIGAATIALKVGKVDFAKYFDSFGLASTTGIDLPNEAKSITKNLQVGSDIDVATASYGQGIAISPVVMTRALAVIASGGYLVTPHLVKKIEYADGTENVVNAPKTGPVLSKQSVDEVTNMLVTVVDKALKNGNIKMDHYTMAAKTGTAEIADHVNGGYYKDRYLHSFFGFLPAYNPKFLIFLYQIYPKGAKYASETLTDPFDELAKFLINYYNIPPDR